MKVDFFNSKDFLGSKTKESKIRKLSISKSKIMTISVDNLNWMGVTDAVVIGLEEGKAFEGVENTVFYLAASDVEDERSFKVKENLLKRPARLSWMGYRRKFLCCV